MADPLTKYEDVFSEPSLDDYENTKSGNLLARIFRGTGADIKPPDNRAPLVERKYPDKSYYDEFTDYGYDGEQVAQFVEPQTGAKMGTATIAEAKDAHNKDIPFKRMKPVDTVLATQLAQQYAASNRSAVAKLGFDPHRMTTTPPDSPTKLSIGGFYSHIDSEADPAKRKTNPMDDVLWYDMDRPQSGTHEIIHRGIEQLRREGLLPDSAKSSNPKYEEYLVRALMSRYFGNTEVTPGGLSDENTGNKQIHTARKLVGRKVLDDIEDAAAKLVAKRRPGGPR